MVLFGQFLRGLTRTLCKHLHLSELFPSERGGGREDAQNLFVVWNLLSHKISSEGNYLNINFEEKVLILPDRCMCVCTSLTCLQSILQAEISHLLETKEVTQALENKLLFLIWSEFTQVAY